MLLVAGVDLWFANVTARVTAAVGGFLLNGFITFRRQRGVKGWGVRHLLRFLLVWCVLTAVSTSLLAVIKLLAQSDNYWLVAGKMGVEGGLAVISFIASKWWVYTPVASPLSSGS